MKKTSSIILSLIAAAILLMTSCATNGIYKKNTGLSSASPSVVAVTGKHGRFCK